MPDKTSMKRSAVLVYDNERCYLDNSSASYLTKTSRNVTLFCTSCQSVISPLRLTTRKIKVLLAAIAWPRINQRCIFFRCSWYRQHSALILPQHNFKLTSTPYCFLIWNNDSLTGGEWRNKIQKILPLPSPPEDKLRRRYAVLHVLIYMEDPEGGVGRVRSADLIFQA